MGNELSAEAQSQGQQDHAFNGLEYSGDQEPFFAPEAGPDASEEFDLDNIKPMDEDELNRQWKQSKEVVNVFNTDVSDQLKQLLMTLHEDYEPSGLKVSLSAKAQEFVPGKPFSLPAGSPDKVIPEFVPGKPFVLPSVEREKSSAAYSDAGSESMSSVSRAAAAAGLGGFNTEAPEFVPSWQKGSATTAVSGDKKVWWYRDPQGAVRGPFSTTEMKAWSDKGYFSGGLEVALSDRGPYLPLSSVYPSPEKPFWKSIEPREFATRMRQHILASRNVM